MESGYNEFDVSASPEDYTTQPNQEKVYSERGDTEAAFYTAMSTPLPFDTYTRVSDDLQLTGESPVVEEVYQKVKGLEKQATTKAAIDVLYNPNINPEDKVNTIRDVMVNTADKVENKYEKIAKVKQSVLDSMALSKPVYDKEDTQLKDNSIKNYFSAYNASIQPVAKRMKELKDKSIGKKVMDFAGALIPMNTTTTYAGLYQALHPEASKANPMQLLPGEIMVKIRKELGTKRGADKVQYANKIVNYLKDNAGFLGNNSLLEMQVLSEVFDNELKGLDDGGVDWDRWINDATGVLDAIGVGQLAKVAVSGGAKLMGISRIGEINNASKKAANDLKAMDNLNPTGEMAKALDTTRENVALMELNPPLTSSNAMPHAASLSDNAIELITDIQSNIAGTIGDGERAVVQSKVTDLIQNRSNKMGVHYLRANSTLEPHDTGFRIKGIYAKNEEYGFSSADAALERGKQLFPDRPVQVYKKGADGNLLTLEEATKVEEAAKAIAKAKQVAAEATPKTVQREVKTMKEVDEPINAALPKNLAGSKPRYSYGSNNFSLKFESDVDKALYIVSQSTPSRADESFMEHLRTLFPSKKNEEIRAMGQRIRDKVIKPIAAKASGDTIQVPYTTKDFAKSRKVQKEVVELVDEPVATRPSDEVAQGVDEQGEYFFSVNQDFSYSSEIKSLGEFGIPEGTVKVNAYGSEYYLTPEARFAREFIDKAVRAVDYSYKVNKKIAKLISPFAKLGTKDQIKIIRVFSKFEGKDLPDPITLKAEYGLTDNHLSVMQNMREAMDIQYYVDNVSHRESLFKDGMMHLVNYEKEYEAWAKPLSLEGAKSASISSVFDPQTGKAVKVNLDQLYESGGSVARLARSERVGDNLYDYALVSKESGTTVKELPVQTLPYTKNYFTRFYEHNYYVYEKLPSGKFRTVAAVDTKEEAAALTAKNEAYDYRFARELGEVELSEMEREITYNHGGPIFGKRGEQLAGYKELSDIADPLSSMQKAIRMFANRSSIHQLSKEMKDRFLKTYADILPKNNGTPVWPKDKAFFERTGKNEDMIKDAKSLYEYINVIEGHESSLLYKHWSNTLLNVANSTGVPAIQKALFGLSKVDPTKVARTFAFYTLLVSNPGRQLLVQAQQPLFLFSIAPTFFLNPKNGALATALLSASQGNKSYGMLAKLTGMNEKEFAATVRAWNESGLDAAVDSHQWVENASISLSHRIKGNPLLIAGSRVNEIGKKGLDIAKAVGFNAGEYINMMTTWMIARQRYLDKFPKADLSTREAINEIAADARHLSLNMGSRAGNAAYNQGFLGAYFQFMSVRHKAILSMLPTNMGGSQSFTNKEKMLLAANQVMMFGVDGFGAARFYNDMIDRLGLDIDPDTNRMVKAGLIEMGINGTISSITNEKSDVDFSSQFALLSGLTDVPLAMMAHVFTQPDHVVKAMYTDLTQSGLFSAQEIPAVAAMNRVVSSVVLANHFADHPTLDTDEKIMGVVKELGTITGQYSNTMKALAAMELGYSVTRYGTPTVRKTYSDAVAQMLFGLPTQQETDTRFLAEDVYSQGLAKQVVPPIKTIDYLDAKDDAKVLYNRLKERIVLHEGASSTPDLQFKLIDQAFKEEARILQLFPENHMYAYQVKKEFFDLIVNDYNTGAIDSFLDRIYKQGRDVPTDALVTQLSDLKRNAQLNQNQAMFVDDMISNFKYERSKD